MTAAVLTYEQWMRLQDPWADAMSAYHDEGRAPEVAVLREAAKEKRREERRR